MWNNLKTTSKNTTIEWICIKVPFVLSCYFWIKHSLEATTSIATQKGVCYLFDCNLLVSDSVKIFLLVLTVVLSTLYVLEKKMLLVTFLLFLICFIVFSAHESFGVQDRTGIVTLIWLVQFLAYFLKWKNPDFNLSKNRISFPVQVIVACYTLSALSKLYVSGPSWFLDSQSVILQMLKSNQTQYLDGEIPFGEVMSPKIGFVAQYGKTMSVLLFGALMIELSSGLGLINKKMRLLYGCLLLFLHFGIDFFFGIVISAFYKSMIIFMINPFYLLYLLIRKIPIFQPKTT